MFDNLEENKPASFNSKTLNIFEDFDSDFKV